MNLRNITEHETSTDEQMDAVPQQTRDVVLMLGHRRRQGANIKPTLGERLVFAGSFLVRRDYPAKCGMAIKQLCCFVSLNHNIYIAAYPTPVMWILAMMRMRIITTHLL